VPWYQPALQWAGAHWAVLAVVIPVAGAIATGIMNHFLAVARENRARKRELSDRRSRVHADLAVRLLTRCVALQTVATGTQPDLQSWREENAHLRARAEMPDVIETLGTEYAPFVAAIEQERRTIERLSAAAQTSGASGALDIIQYYASFIHDFGEPTQAKRLQKFARQNKP
jgi:hypothetical protein